MGITLNNDQIFVCSDLEHWWYHGTRQVREVSGKAGCGKTFLIKYFIDRIGIPYSDVLFVAYMGKAVNQLNKHGLNAKTIHSSCYDPIKVPLLDENGNPVYKKNGERKTTIEFRLKEEIPGNPKLIVIDEGFMVPENQAKDLLSFNIPIVVLGDSNQLPPVFGKPFFFQKPDLVLNQIMRQKENDPIVYLANELLEHRRLKNGVYGNSAVIPKKNLTKFQMINSDAILTCTNNLRNYVNNLFREDFLNIGDLSFPHYGEKIICRKNNWNTKIKMKNSDLYLTNGLAGYVDYVEPESYNKKSIKIDFRPDFSKKSFRNIQASIPYINERVGKHDTITYGNEINNFEYAYAITTHLCQGSEYENVMFMEEDNYFGSTDDYFRLLYSAVTRASKSILYVH